MTLRASAAPVTSPGIGGARDGGGAATRWRRGEEARHGATRRCAVNSEWQLPHHQLRWLSSCCSAPQVGRMENQREYDRSHQRFTWRGALKFHENPKKRKRSKILSCSHSKILSRPRDRQMDDAKDVVGSCVWYSLATALEAANRACGVDVGTLSWEDLYDLVDISDPCPEIAALEILKCWGIRREDDYEKGNLNAKRFKVAHYSEFCDVDLITDEVPCGLDQNSIKEGINSFLSKTVMLATFPISQNYYLLVDGNNFIYEYDASEAVLVHLEDGSSQICTHTVVITGFGFEEKFLTLSF